MQKRTTFHVVHVAEGWAIKKKGQKKPIKNFSKKTRALLLAKKLAKKAKLGQLVVHKKSGKIQLEYTYGADPRRSRG